MKRRRFLVIFIYLLLLISGPTTVLLNTPLSTVFRNQTTLIVTLQRLLGTVAYVMLFGQIVLGSKMGEWIKSLGGKAYRYHITHGLIAYVVILLHPLMQTVLDFKLRGPFAAAISLLPGSDIFLNFGKIALLLITAAVFVGYFRTKPFLRRNWRKFHILTYIAFIFVGIHSWNLGTDVKDFPFVLTFIFGGVVGNLIIFQKIYFYFSKKLMVN